ncbi:MAG TPA: hypothetical protein VGZ50_04130 [Actinomycetota bacterium]|nr:hypothetical protein [Actinomycetota bacterium]
MKIRPAGVAAWSVWGLAIISIGLAMFSRFLPEDIPLLAGFVAYATVGAIVVSRRPRNPVGWVFVAVGALAAVGALGESYLQAVRQSEALPSLAVWAAWTQEWFWFPLVALATLFTVLLFPSGLPSPRWRPVLWVCVVAAVLGTLTAAFSPSLQAGGRTIANPIGIDTIPRDFDENSVAFQIFGGTLLLGLVAATFSIFLRFRRSRGEERQQLKWFAFAAALMPSFLSVGIAFPAIEETATSQVLFGSAILGIPVSCGIAITRYRLYDIDRVINRTLVYAILTALLVGIYVGGAVGLGGLVRSVTGQENNALVIAASTLAVAALFGPVRRRIQEFIDRRFYRSKYDAARTLDAFNAKLREQVDLDSLAGELVGVVRETMQPSHVFLWLRTPGLER